jgi:hypothetical protein
MSAPTDIGRSSNCAQTSTRAGPSISGLKVQELPKRISRLKAKRQSKRKQHATHLRGMYAALETPVSIEQSLDETESTMEPMMSTRPFVIVCAGFLFVLLISGGAAVWFVDWANVDTEVKLGSISLLPPSSQPRPTLYHRPPSIDASPPASVAWPPLPYPSHPSLSPQLPPDMPSSPPGGLHQKRPISPPDTPPRNPPPVPTWHVASPSPPASAHDIADRLNARFHAGRASNLVEGAGVLIHTFDNTEEPGRSWRPCTAPSWCAQYGDRMSTTLINARLVHVYGNAVSGVVLSPDRAQRELLCSYGSDGAQVPCKPTMNSR